MNKLAIAAACVLLAGTAYADDHQPGFFVTSHNPGDGANLGGLAGADAHCAKVAAAAGLPARDWKAYLSATGVNARDRIGNGPWYNVKGELLAQSLAELHGDANPINKEVGLDETGAKVNGRGDQPNRHDILTGSNSDGTLAVGVTCSDWTTNGEGHAMVGHHDRIGLRDDAPSKSWNASHPSRACGLEALRATGGDGLLYCFAAD